MAAAEKLRLDKWLWSVRVFKTRTQATDTCARGKVKCNGNSAKASKAVTVGDVIEVRSETRKWLIRITGLLDSRVQYAQAIQYYVDLAPPGEKEKPAGMASAFHGSGRRGSPGRPTKKQRRDLEGFTEG